MESKAHNQAGYVGKLCGLPPTWGYEHSVGCRSRAGKQRMAIELLVEAVVAGAARAVVERVLRQVEALIRKGPRSRPRRCSVQTARACLG